MTEEQKQKKKEASKKYYEKHKEELKIIYALKYHLKKEKERNEQNKTNV